MSEAQPPAPTILDRVHVVCSFCDMDFIFGRALFLIHFGDEIDELMAKIVSGQVRFKCTPCSGAERKYPALQ